MYSATEEELNDILSFAKFHSSRIYSKFTTKPPMEDLLSISNLGIVRALHKFDPSKGIPFTTVGKLFVKWAVSQWLRDEFFCSRHKGKSGKLPRHMEYSIENFKPDNNIFKYNPEFERTAELEKRLARFDDYHQGMVREVIQGESVKSIAAKRKRSINRVSETLRELTGDPTFRLLGNV